MKAAVVDKAVPGLRFAIRDDRGESEASSNHTAEGRAQLVRRVEALSKNPLRRGRTHAPTRFGIEVPRPLDLSPPRPPHLLS